jgi:hypothetical protein
MIAYIDARRRRRKVIEALSRLSERDQRVLGAYYGAEPSERGLGQLADVACLTKTAWVKNRARAARGVHETIAATVRWLAAATAPTKRAAFAEIHEEAMSLVAVARANYARARRRSSSHG